MNFTLTKPREHQPANVGTIRFSPETHPHRGMKADRATLDKLHGIAAAVASCLPAGVDLKAATQLERTEHAQDHARR